MRCPCPWPPFARFLQGHIDFFFIPHSSCVLKNNMLDMQHFKTYIPRLRADALPHASEHEDNSSIVRAQIRQSVEVLYTGRSIGMKNGTRTCRFIFAAAIWFAASMEATYAQTTGTVSGAVVDPTGANVPDVNLTLRSVETGAVRTTVTDSTGSYIFNLVLPQTYELTAKKSGFSVVVIKGLVVKVDSPTRQDISLQVEQSREQVTVAANATTVYTDTPGLGDVIESRTVTSLPLNGRDFLQLATLTAGAYPPSPSSSTQSLSGGRASLTVSVDGSRESSAEFLFDGIESKHDYYGAAGFEPPPDSIAEFKIEQGYFSPQFGLPGVVNVVIKSGGNSFHGSAYEFLRNDVLDAKNFFDINKPPYRQNQFGGGLGGPILRNKLFFFGSYDGLRIRQGFTQSYLVPTQAELQGNFAGEAPIINPSTGLPYPGNQIPTSDFSPFASKFNSYVPAPSGPPNPSFGGNNLIGSYSYILNNTQYNAKIDYTISDKDSIFGRFSYLDSDQNTTSLLPGNGNINPLNTRNLALSWTHIFSPYTVNNFRAGLDRTFLDTGSAANASGPDYPAQLGLQNLNKIEVCNSLPAVNIATYSSLGFTFENCTVTGNTNQIYLDNLSLTRGRHDITLGGRLTRRNLHDIAANGQSGIFNFSGQYTGNPVADYLIGQPQSVSGSQPIAPFYIRAWDPEVYANDNWHLTKQLTLNYGLRWQYGQPPYETQNKYGYFDFDTGQVVYAGVNGARRSPLTSRWTNFAPRLGFAYSPLDRVSIRGSYGIFYDRIPGNELVWGGLLPLFQPSYSATGGLTTSGIDISTLFPPASVTPQGAPGSGLIDITDRKTAYVQQWTLSVQTTLPWNTFAQVAYVGARGEHESTRSDMNQLAAPPPPGTTDIQPLRPYPHFSYMLTDRGIGDLYYESLQGTLRKDLSHGLSFLSSYTFASSIQTTGGWGTISYRWTQLDRGPGVDDPRQRWVTSLVYNLPFEANSKGFMHQAFGGWTVNGILTLQSGYPFSVSTPTDQSDTGLIFPSPQPNRVCNGNLPTGQRNKSRWFDTDCFVNPPYYSFGNAGINYLVGPGTKNLDFAVLKTFPVFDTHFLEFRSEFFNGLNFVNFHNPNATVGTASYGTITSAGTGRQIQFALKFVW